MSWELFSSSFLLLEFLHTFEMLFCHPKREIKSFEVVYCEFKQSLPIDDFANHNVETILRTSQLTKIVNHLAHAPCADGTTPGLAEVLLSLGSYRGTAGGFKLTRR
jgi:hypothetical protein